MVAGHKHFGIEQGEWIDGDGEDLKGDVPKNIGEGRYVPDIYSTYLYIHIFHRRRILPHIYIFINSTEGGYCYDCVSKGGPAREGGGAKPDRHKDETYRRVYGKIRIWHPRRERMVIDA